MNYDIDTISAIASGLTDSGIGIIRLSGEKSLDILEQIFVPYNTNSKVKEFKTYTAHYGHIVNPATSEILDECIVLYMKGPHSYTGEDVVEIDSHGGIYVANRILQLTCKYGCRLANPGEFTKRAFLNGRMDLTQAEAVMDVIKADNDNALRISVNQLTGKLKNKIIQMRDIIIHENAYIEYALDDPEHVSLDGFSEKLENNIDSILEELKDLLDHANEGRIIKEGINTVIVGKPNAGKSSLLNVLLKEDRAIVTDIPGTTRDTLEERTIVEGIPLNIIDTAGIRDTEDIVEKIGVDKAKSSIENADLVLYVIDCSRPLEQEDYDIMELIANKNVIILLNKSDLKQVVTKEIICDYIDAQMISVSMLSQEGIGQFYKILKDMFFSGGITMNRDVVISNERQKESVQKAYDSLCRVKESIQLQMPEDFYTIDLLDAYESLGDIIGESMHDDLVNRIFEDFCTGK